MKLVDEYVEGCHVRLRQSSLGGVWWDGLEKADGAGLANTLEFVEIFDDGVIWFVYGIWYVLA